jgi:hypothetical protein
LYEINKMKLLVQESFDEMIRYYLVLPCGVADHRCLIRCNGNSATDYAYSVVEMTYYLEYR